MNGKTHAIFWQFGATTALDLGDVTPEQDGTSAAFSINNSGVVVGNSSITFSAATHAFRALNSIRPIGPSSDLGTPQDSGNSDAYDINESNETVGQATFIVGGVAQLHGFYRGSGQGLNQGFNDLGVFGSGNRSSAQSINNHGHIVGWSRTTSTGSNHAVLWLNNGQLKDLNDGTLVAGLPGWTLQQAEDIGGQGHIVGWGTLNGVLRAFLLTPSAPY